VTEQHAAPTRLATAAQAPGARRILVVLALANLVNFYDRTVPAIVVEPLKAEFGFSDVQIGVLSGAFTVVYAVAGLVLGRMADRGSRRVIMAVGLVVWSLFTALSGGAWSFASLLLFRLGVGIGEASYAPAANAMIFDAFPPQRRSRAIAVFQLGIPVGLLVAFLSVGWMVEAFDSWRIPFFVAAVPGLVLAVLMLRLPEPRRGQSEEATTATADPVTTPPPPGPAQAAALDRPIRSILAIPTLRWLIVAGVGIQVPTYAIATFLVPLLQRYFDLSIGAASVSAGLILGVTGIVGLVVGGTVADRASRRSLRARLTVGAIGLGLAAPLTLAALLVDHTAAVAFVGLFAAGWFFQYFFGTAAFPAIADVVEPRLRATAVAVFFAAFYLLGGAFGPLIAGGLSDAFAARASATADVTAEAIGLHQALLAVVPLFLLVGALAAWAASRTVEQDHTRMVHRKAHS
jgi:MFS family permease